MERSNYICQCCCLCHPCSIYLQCSQTDTTSQRASCIPTKKLNKICSLPGNKYLLLHLSSSKGAYHLQIFCKLIPLFYNSFLIFSTNSVYSCSVRYFSPGFIANTPPHSYPSLYFGTRWKCR